MSDEKVIGAFGLTMAKQYGVDTDKVHRINIELDSLRRSGILVMVEVKGTGMFTRRATFAEYGVRDDDGKVKRYTPGSKYLIPKESLERLRSVEVRMRESLDKLSFGDIEGFRPYRWLPWSAYPAFKSRWDSLAEEFREVKLEIVDHYDHYLDTLEAEFAAGAMTAWESVIAQGYTALIYNDKGYWEKSDFVDAVVNDALNMFPTREKIISDLKADYRVGLVYAQADYEADDIHTNHLLDVAREEKEKAKAEAQAAKLIEAEAQEKFDHTLRMNRLAQQEKELRIDAMIQAEAEHARKQLGEIQSPFEAVFVSLRAQIAEDCESMLASIQKNGFVRGKIAEKARGLVELYDLLAIHDDVALRAKLANLRAQIGAVGDERTKETPERDVAAVSETLKQVIELSHVAVEDLENCRASFIEF